jgi:hypothetical protein
MNEIKDTAVPNEWELPVEEIIKEATNQMTYDNSNKKTRKTTMIIDVNNEEEAPARVLLLAVKSNVASDSGYVTMYVGASNIQPLEFDVSHFGYVQNVKDVFKVYEVFVPHLDDMTYVVEVTPCYGRAEVFISKNFKKLTKGHYITKANHMTNGRVYAVLDNPVKEHKKYIVAVKSLNNATDEYKDFEVTEFTIEIKKYPGEIAKESYIEKYYVPKESEIEWKIAENGKEIELSWPPVYNHDGTEQLPKDQVVYDVFMTYDTSAGIDSPCSLQYDFDPINDELITSTSYTLDIDDDLEEVTDHESVYFNVVAYVVEVVSNDEMSEYPIVYHPLKMNSENIEYFSDWSNGFIWVIAFVIIAILVVVIVFFYTKYRKVQKKLNFEVREVRNASDFGQEMKERKVYNQFGREEEGNE